MGRVVRSFGTRPKAPTVADQTFDRIQFRKLEHFTQSLADGVQKTASLHYQDVAKGWLGAVGKLVAALSQ